MIKNPITDKIEEIKAHPENHRHTFTALRACCIVDGNLIILLMDAHKRYASTGSNGGKRCDVISGPCSCGAWH